MSAGDVTPLALAGAWRETTDSLNAAHPGPRSRYVDGYIDALRLCAEQIEAADRLACAQSMARHPAGRHRAAEELSLREKVERGRHRAPEPVDVYPEPLSLAEAARRLAEGE